MARVADGGQTVAANISLLMYSLNPRAKKLGRVLEA